MKLAAVFVLCCLFISSWAQSPEVPHKMEFAGITLSIRDDARREIQKDVDMLTQSPKYFGMKVDRAKIYFPIIEKVFEQERVPDDFKYLSLQESALIADAVSTSNAVGYWQFKDFTAIEMGLRVDKEVDERMSIEASSRAAAKYLKKNNYYFNNWVYALQAYQMGAGGVLQSVKNYESGSTHMEITSKTYWYVKKFLAHKIAYENAVKGPGSIKLLTLVNQTPQSLSALAKEFVVSEEELREYNKWVKKGTIPGDRPYTVFIPTADENKALQTAVARASKPVEPVARVDAKPAMAKSEMQTINGIPAMKAHMNETSAMFAKRANIDLSYFLKCNDISISDRLVGGEYYYLKKKKARASVPQYVAKEGDDWWSISQRYGVQLKKLKKYNGISAGSKVAAGSVVSLSGKRTVAATVYASEVTEINPEETFNWTSQTETASQRPVILVTNETVQPTLKKEETIVVLDSGSNPGMHTVGAGETLYSIAKRYKVGVMSVVEWNNLNLQEGIKPGQVLIVKEPISGAESELTAKVEETPPAEAKEVIHQVKSSDTLYSVARQYGVTIKELMEWNGKKDFTLSVGENLRIMKK